MPTLNAEVTMVQYLSYDFIRVRNEILITDNNCIFIVLCGVYPFCLPAQKIIFQLFQECGVVQELIESDLNRRSSV